MQIDIVWDSNSIFEERDNHYQVNELKHKNFESEEGLNAVGPVQTVSAVRSNSAILFSEENPINYYYFGIRSKKFFIRTWKGKTEKVILKIRLKRRCFLWYITLWHRRLSLCRSWTSRRISGPWLWAWPSSWRCRSWPPDGSRTRCGGCPSDARIVCDESNNKIIYDYADTKRRQIRTYNR